MCNNHYKTIKDQDPAHRIFIEHHRIDNNKIIAIIDNIISWMNDKIVGWNFFTPNDNREMRSGFFLPYVIIFKSII